MQRTRRSGTGGDWHDAPDAIPFHPNMPVLADSKQVAEIVDRFVADLSAAMKQWPGEWAIVGLRARGDVLAKRLAERLKVAHNGAIDIALYRDDLSGKGANAVVRTSEIDFPMDGMNVLLVDDVLMTGRSIRAAIQSLMDYGRPRCVKLLVLVDRGGRELPIAPDFVGLRVNTERADQIEVRLRPADDEDRVSVNLGARRAGEDRA